MERPVRATDAMARRAMSSGYSCQGDVVFVTVEREMLQAKMEAGRMVPSRRIYIVRHLGPHATRTARWGIAVPL